MYTRRDSELPSPGLDQNVVVSSMVRVADVARPQGYHDSLDIMTFVLFYDKTPCGRRPPGSQWSVISLQGGPSRHANLGIFKLLSSTGLGFHSVSMRTRPLLMTSECAPLGYAGMRLSRVVLVIVEIFQKVFSLRSWMMQVFPGHRRCGQRDIPS